MGITHVIRAEEHLTNTLRQCLILDALEVPRPRYAHCSLILGEDRSKLSKRHGATSVTQFRREVGDKLAGQDCVVSRFRVVKGLGVGVCALASAKRHRISLLWASSSDSDVHRLVATVTQSASQSWLTCKENVVSHFIVMLHAQGFLPRAMVNYLSMLGWNDGTEKEIFTEQELVEAFDLRRVIKSSAVFDMTKLR